MTNTKKRTTTKKVLASTVDVVLGGVTYKVKPLAIRAAAAWLDKYEEYMRDLLAYQSMEVKSFSSADFTEGFREIMCSAPMRMTELLFEYAPDLPRETILDTATPLEIQTALQEVLCLANPLLAAAQIERTISMIERLNASAPTKRD